MQYINWINVDINRVNVPEREREREREIEIEIKKKARKKMGIKTT